jgi:predicted nucleotidyltransferase component of viral defense system
MEFGFERERFADRVVAVISKQDLQRIAAEKGYPLDAIEKDYALTWALKAIYANPRLHKFLVFKGGTCLSKVYFENYRLSEDLDFSICKDEKVKLTFEEASLELDSCFAAANSEGAPSLEVKKEETRANPGMILYQVRQHGPAGGSSKIKLEVKTDESVSFQVQEKSVLSQPYKDLPVFSVACYDIHEILLEKLRAAMQRGKSRDYYDLWQMLCKQKGLISYNEHDFQRLWFDLALKCGKSKVVFEPEKIFQERRLQEAKDYWESDLLQLAKNAPEFDDAISDLKEPLFEAFKLAEFSDSLDSDSLLDVARNEVAGERLLKRGIELLKEELNSRERRSVLKGIEVTRAVWFASDSVKKLVKSELFPVLRELSRDSDAEIIGKANALASEMSAFEIMG